MNAQQIKDRFVFYENNHEGLYPPSKNARGVYVGILKKACKSDENRRLVLRYLTGETSSKEITENQWVALKKMCDKPPAELERIVNVVLAEVVKQDGQLEFDIPKNP